MAQIEFLNDADLCRVLDLCLPPRTDAQYLALWILATGVRVGEISGCVRGGKQRGGIRLSDIRIINDREMYSRIWGEKTDQLRDIAIMPEAVPWLTPRILRLRTAGEEWLFPTNVKRRPICKMTLQRWWAQIMKEAGCRLRDGRIPNAHVGRSTYATWGALKLSREALQDQLGHKPGSRTTAQYYTTTMVEYRYHPNKPIAWRERLRNVPERRLQVV
jgi:integrase